MNEGYDPANIISGYKACGIYSYNPNAILKQFEGLLSLPTPQSSLQESTVIHSEFSDQQIKLFEARFLEGYDIFEDDEYILWLKSYHPEAVPRDLDDKGIKAFSTQQIELFETRYLEGYDIFEDEEYVLWLKSYHPEAIPRDLTEKVMNDDKSEQGQEDSELNREDHSDEEFDHSQQQDYPDAMYTFDPPSSHPIVNDTTIILLIFQ